MTVDLAIAGLSCAIWLYLAVARGGFWQFRDRLETGIAALDPPATPEVQAVVPARNEADVIARSTLGLCTQAYDGRLGIVLVDDGSDDGTAQIARRSAMDSGAADRHLIVTGKPLEPGWTGKLFAVSQGVAAAVARWPDTRYLLLTDADIELGPGVVRDLVAKAEAGGLALVSVMAMLRTQTAAERLLVPPFVYFFAMLYPFPWSNDPRRATAAAAGGCMLVRRDALERAGGIATIRRALIDDCTLAAAIKPHGPTWLGLSSRVVSLRPYPTFGDFGQMVARSAYTQLRHSPLLLAGTVAGMLLTYLAPVWYAVAGDGLERGLGMFAWLLMSLTFLPILAIYRLSLLRAPALPLAALCYLGFTIQSAIAHWRGRGGLWKGRVQAAPGREHG